MKKQIQIPYSIDRTEEVRRCWNDEFRRFGHKYGTDPSALALAAVTQGHYKPGMRVLEIGGGTGRNSLYLAKNGIYVVHLDIADRAVALSCGETERDWGGSRMVQVRIDFFDALDILKTGCFNGILANFLFHLLGEELRFAFLEISTTLLAPGGRLVLSAPSRNDIDYAEAMEGKHGQPLESNTWTIRGHPQHFFSQDEIRDVFSNGGLKLLSLAELTDLELITTHTRNTVFWMAVAEREDV